ncbi:hypothetical protein YUMDRAFT_06517 [Streptomyces sp. OspMP-M45]|nr:hypothetical protein [Streptomyces sp. SID4925]MYR76568.1 hypothetical protein [Streptomyces sp. SID4925]SBV01672.1 hypothetical protein YUMDRAFT_06517 [Streptomyces sp. OspMP-M45]
MLAAALRAQGEPGGRALGLLQDARWALTGTGLVRPAEVAAACVRSAADTLLKLPGAPESVGLQAAAQDLLAAVDAVRLPATNTAADSGAPRVPAAGPAWDRMTGAAKVLRGELKHPGGYHRGRARGVIERLRGVTLGAAQERALDVWGVVYGLASGILHGRAAGPDDAAHLYTELLHAARELLVPLPDRAARVLELTALTAPGPDDARELARWTDPRAEAFFFRSHPAPAWLGLLQEHAAHLLLPDTPAGGSWPAAEFLAHVASADPHAARAWLAAHAQEVAAAGRPALDAVLHLAARGEALIAPPLVRTVLFPRPAVEPGRQEGRTLRLAAEWACTVAPDARDRDWIIVTELLLKATVEAEHTAAGYRRAAPAEQALAGAQPIYVSASPLLRVLLNDPADWAQAAQAEAARMPDHLTGSLLRKLVASAHPAGGTHPRVQMIRAVLANLLARDLELTDPAARRIVFHQDLDKVCLGAPAAFGGPCLARALLDLAASDADAGADLAERTGRWKKVADIDGWLHRRLLAAHLTDRTPHEEPPAAAGGSATKCLTPTTPPDASAGGDSAGQWRSAAHTLVPHLLAVSPDPEPARLVAAVWATCPPQETTALEEAARVALGTPPPPHEINAVLPDTTDPVNGTVEPLVSWLRAWDWSPVLPARLCTGFEPLFAALARRQPEGPADPRSATPLVPVKATTVVDGQDLVQLAAAQGPPAAARLLTTAANQADDTGTEAYADLLNRLVATAPAAWTADVPAVLTALGPPMLRGFYLAAATAAAHRPGILPQHNLPHALDAALQLRRSLPPGPQGPMVLLCADEAVFGLLTEAWRRPPCLAEGLLSAALAHLHALAEQLTRPADPPSADTPPHAEPVVAPDPAVRALECLLNYAESQTRTGIPMPDTVLDLLAEILTARPREKEVSTVIGPRLPALHRHAPAFAATHHTALTALDGPSPAAAWLSYGPADPQLLTTLDRTTLLAAPRRGVGGLVEHLAHALTADPHHLGDPKDVFAEIATGPGGPGAASWLLQVLGWRLDPGWSIGAAGVLRFPRTALNPPTGPELAAVTTVWKAALAADLPPGSLAGAGYFAHLPLDDEVWLPLARASTEHTPPDSPGTTAERATAHPGSPDALVLTALLVVRPADAWGAHTVLPHARALLRAVTQVDGHAHPDAVAQLREALINAGEVDLARTPTEVG